MTFPSAIPYTLRQSCCSLLSCSLSLAASASAASRSTCNSAGLGRNSPVIGFLSLNSPSSQHRSNPSTALCPHIRPSAPSCIGEADTARQPACHRPKERYEICRPCGRSASIPAHHIRHTHRASQCNPASRCYGKQPQAQSPEASPLHLSHNHSALQWHRG